MASVATRSPIVVLLKYTDLDAALTWLVGIAGSRLESHEDNDRTAVLRSRTGMIFAQSDPAATPMTGARMYLYVGDVEAHYQRATAAGVEAAPPETMPWGDRVWDTSDPQGHPWTFAAS